MPTRNITKGVPPRGHLLPKASAKKVGSKSRSQKNKKNKRTAGSDSDEGDISDVACKKKSTKRQHVESDSELEIIGNDVGAPEEEIEEVNIIGNTVQVENEENEASMTLIDICFYSPSCRMKMNLPIIRKELLCKWLLRRKI